MEKKSNEEIKSMKQGLPYENNVFSSFGSESWCYVFRGKVRRASLWDRLLLYFFKHRGIRSKRRDKE